MPIGLLFWIMITILMFHVELGYCQRYYINFVSYIMW